MKTQTAEKVGIPENLVEAFPLEREVEHCGHRWTVSPFEFYATCPRCGVRVKARGFSAVDELEDVFDAVFEWLRRPSAATLLTQRQKALETEDEDQAE
jgi:hypothetical protein